MFRAHLAELLLRRVGLGHDALPALFQLGEVLLARADVLHAVADVVLEGGIVRDGSRPVGEELG